MKTKILKFNLPAYDIMTLEDIEDEKFRETMGMQLDEIFLITECPKNYGIIPIAILSAVVQVSCYYQRHHQMGGWALLGERERNFIQKMGTKSDKVFERNWRFLQNEQCIIMASISPYNDTFVAVSKKVSDWINATVEQEKLWREQMQKELDRFAQKPSKPDLAIVR